jgi:uridine kinase
MNLLNLFTILFLALTQLSFSSMNTSSDVYIVGISGGTGSGKTYVSQKIKEALGDDIIVLAEDSYYKDLSHLSPDKRAQTNFDHPDSIDFNLLKDHILKLKDYKSIKMPQYDFKTHSRKKQCVEVSPQGKRIKILFLKYSLNIDLST